MFINCPHCHALVATDPVTDQPPPQCPRCAALLREPASVGPAPVAGNAATHAPERTGATDAPPLVREAGDAEPAPVVATTSHDDSKADGGALDERSRDDGKPGDRSDDDFSFDALGIPAITAPMAPEAPTQDTADVVEAPAHAPADASADAETDADIDVERDDAAPLAPSNDAQEPAAREEATRIDTPAPAIDHASVPATDTATHTATHADPATPVDSTSDVAGTDADAPAAPVAAPAAAAPQHGPANLPDVPDPAAATATPATGPGPAVGTTPPPTATRAPRKSNTPSFARNAGATDARPRHFWPKLAAIGGLSVLLMLQLLVADRARLATDARWRPLLTTLCGVMRCSLPAWREPTAFALLERDVRSHPSVPGALRVTATFRNDARWPQPWPALRLTLSDVDGQPAGARVFAPRDYLGGTPTQTGLATGQTATVAFDIVEPTPRIVAFTFDFE